MKIYGALLTLLWLVVMGQGAAAQELLSPPSPEFGSDDMPPDFGVGEPGDTSELLPQPMTDADLATGFEGSIIGEPMHKLMPAYFESSGTWLRRGFWYTEIDYVLLNRGWDRKGLQLGFEFDQGQVPAPENPGGIGVVVGTNELRLRGQRPGADGLARVKLGRFLFRDSSNRDHMTEIGWYGGGEWDQAASIQASTANGIEIPDYIDRVNPSFDGARGMSFEYGSEMNTAEWNYVVRQRMHRDQMVMEPSGQWVRKASPTRTYSYLAGLRYLNHREQLDFDATDIPVSAALDENGFYRIRTENNMIGTQVGGSLARETARWTVGANAKIGAYWNRIDLNSQFQVGETEIVNSGSTGSEEDDLSFVAESQFFLKWHLRPNMSFRAGLDMLFVDSIALAPHQLNFIPGGFSPIAAAGDSVYLGTSLGIESYW